jgi:hypothetical protein
VFLDGVFLDEVRAAVLDGWMLDENSLPCATGTVAPPDPAAAESSGIRRF